MTDMPAAAGSGRAPGSDRAPGRAEPRLIPRPELIAALDRAAARQVTIISASAGSGKTTHSAWASKRGPDRRVAFMSVRPGEHDAQPFWLAVPGRGPRRVRPGESTATPATPGGSGSAMAARVLSELSSARAGSCSSW